MRGSAEPVVVPVLTAGSIYRDSVLRLPIFMELLLSEVTHPMVAVNESLFARRVRRDEDDSAQSRGRGERNLTKEVYGTIHYKMIHQEDGLNSWMAIQFIIDRLDKLL